MKRGLRYPPFQISSPLSFRSPPGLQGTFFLASQYYIWSPETVLMVRKIRDTFEFDQAYKQVESKMQVTWKISSNKIKLVWLKMLSVTKDMEMIHTGLTPCQYNKWDCQVFINIKIWKKVFKISKDYIRMIFVLMVT